MDAALALGYLQYTIMQKASWCSHSTSRDQRDLVSGLQVHSGNGRYISV